MSSLESSASSRQTGSFSTSEGTRLSGTPGWVIIGGSPRSLVWGVHRIATAKLNNPQTPSSAPGLERKGEKRGVPSHLLRSHHTPRLARLPLSRSLSLTLSASPPAFPASLGRHTREHGQHCHAASRKTLAFAVDVAVKEAAAAPSKVACSFPPGSE